MSIEYLILFTLVGALAVVILAQSVVLHRLERKLKATEGQAHPVGVSQPTTVELEARLKSAYEAEIAKATQTFGQDLKGTSTQLSEQVSRLTTSVIEEELEAYQKTLEAVRQTATETMDQIHQAVEQQRVELRHGMEAEMAAERQRLADKFDDKLGDVVASYITESLGGGVDLGAQMQYIVNSLEAHKAEIKKDLTSGV